MYNLLATLRRNTPLYLISVINSGDWVWVQLGFPRFQSSSITLRFRKNGDLKPHHLLLEVDDEEIAIQGTSAAEQAAQIWARLEPTALP